MKAYKLLHVVGERLLSFNIIKPNVEAGVEACIELEKGRIIEYKVGKRIRPTIKGSKLFVFNDLDSAKKWGGFLPGPTQIWLVDVDKLYPAPSFVESSPTYIPIAWHRGKLKVDSKTSTPPGSKLCNTIKLIERVQ